MKTSGALRRRGAQAPGHDGDPLPTTLVNWLRELGSYGPAEAYRVYLGEAGFKFSRAVEANQLLMRQLGSCAEDRAVFGARGKAASKLWKGLDVNCEEAGSFFKRGPVLTHIKFKVFDKPPPSDFTQGGGVPEPT